MFKPLTRPPDQFPHVKVNELLSEDGTCWNIELMESIFNEEDCANILKIKNIGLGKMDKLVWHHDTKGIFSVKSVYLQLILDKVGNMDVAESSDNARTMNIVRKKAGVSISKARLNTSFGRQACEFDYSARKLAKPLERRRVRDLAESGALEKYGVERLGRNSMQSRRPRIGICSSSNEEYRSQNPSFGDRDNMEECFDIANSIGSSFDYRPRSRWVGPGVGLLITGGVRSYLQVGASGSVTSQVLVEKSLLGWKEYELEIPRFAFEKFPGSEPILTTQMKSVGESMAVGRTFQESFQKALRSLECGYSGWGCAQVKELNWDWEQLKYSLRVPSPDRIHSIYAAMKRGMKVDDIHELSFIDKWFLTQLKELVDVEQYILARNLSQLTKDDFWEVKRRGFSDKQIAFATKSNEHEVRSKRLSLGVKPAYKRVDTCAAEFEADTPYMYSSYEVECESAPTKRQKVLILGGGPNRIGQGIEFDYCCCHTSFALQDAGYETIMMNSNPETVSTDYDTSDRLYFEPLTVEDVLNIIDLEGPDGIIVQFGGQTPLKLSLPIQRYLDEQKPKCKSGSGFVRIWGTSPDSIDAAEDRERFNAILTELKIEQPKGGIAKSDKDALAIAANIGYPVVVRPSYVLGGRAMEIVYSDEKLVTYLETAVEVDPERPVLIDKYLSDAIEIDIDALADLHGNVVIGGIMEHIEQAGVHSGDSACMLPTKTVSRSCLETIRSWTTKLAKRLNVCGLMNCQYAITASGDVFLLEGNPRASRTVPFVSKAIGHPLAKYAALVMSGKSLFDLNFTKEVIPRHVSVKEAVLPFEKFQGADVLLGPEMRSTGEVMGIHYESSIAFAKAQIAAGQKPPLSGTVFLSLNDLTKPHLAAIARAFVGLGFELVATSGTARVLELEGIPVERVLKMHEGRPHAGDMIANGQIQMMVVTSSGDQLDQIDGRKLRRMALAYKIPVITTVAGALATAEAIKSLKCNKIEMTALQDYFSSEKENESSSKSLQSVTSTQS
ncbi:hypothetical protein DH2020_035194 [Rehmannia glutinosa]|uniref:Carbamoyl-phosphate synthase (glutamine-hydrolyzing) n=1 Tax=Rehmannia glutinosa TaxID=99300 RepID=A0ABR0V762_REHGL